MYDTPSHNLNMDSERRIGISKAKRMGIVDQKNVPGPGAYDIKVQNRDAVRN